MIITPNDKHEVTYQELVQLVGRHADADGLSALEILAIASNMVGKLIAMQDQRKVTVAQAMQLVAKNIETGNQQVLQRMQNPMGTA